MQVVGVATRDGRPWVYVDDGLYGSFGNIIWEGTRPLMISEKEVRGDVPASSLRPTVVAGPTCDSVDILAEDYELPPLEVGDLILTPNMGAYTLATTTAFNSIPPATVVSANLRSELLSLT